MAMITPLKTSELLESIVRWAVELMRADAGEIFMWDPERGVLEQSISFGFIEVFQGTILKPGEGLGGKVFETGQPLIVPDYASWEGRVAIYDKAPPFTGTFAVPMRWQDEIIGVLAIDADARRRAFDQSDVRLATLFANVAAQAIVNAQLYEELQDRSQKLQYTLEREVAQRTAELAHRALQLETSARVSREITAILEADRLLPRVVELIRESFDYYSVLVFLWDAGAERLVLHAASGAGGRRLIRQGLALAADGTSLNSRVLRSNEAIVVNDVSQEPAYQAVALLSETQSELVIPLRIGQRVLGTLDVQSERRDAFRQDDLLVLQSLGDQIAVAIENARLYDRSRELAILEERTRLARELHDSASQSLFGVELHARAVATYLRSDPDRAEEQLQALRDTAREALSEMRSLILDLRPAPLHEAGLVPALRQQIERLRRPGGPELDLQTTGARRLPVDVEQGLFRIAQEAQRNATAHARAQRITVSVEMQRGWVELGVQDDGQGFDAGAAPDEARPSFGLVGIRERAALLEAEMEIQSAPGAGTRLWVRVPLEQEGEN